LELRPNTARQSCMRMAEAGQLRVTADGTSTRPLRVTAVTYWGYHPCHSKALTSTNGSDTASDSSPGCHSTANTTRDPCSTRPVSRPH
jgi:hypothetical protein